MQTQAALTADQTEQADEVRTKRLFIGFLSSVLGVDQTLNGQDGAPVRTTGQYLIANPDGTYSVLGQSVSNQNTAAATAAGFPVPLLLLVGVFLFLLKS